MRYSVKPGRFLAFKVQVLQLDQISSLGRGNCQGRQDDQSCLSKSPSRSLDQHQTSSSNKNKIKKQFLHSNQFFFFQPPPLMLPLQPLAILVSSNKCTVQQCNKIKKSSFASLSRSTAQHHFSFQSLLLPLLPHSDLCLQSPF